MSDESSLLLNILCYECGKIIPKGEKDKHKLEHHKPHKDIPKSPKK